MSFKTWEEKVLARPGAKERVEELERGLLFAHDVVLAREEADVSEGSASSISSRAPGVPVCDSSNEP